MIHKEHIKRLGFLPKENSINIFQKKYPNHNDYVLEVDFNKQKFNFGSKIKFDSKTTQNFNKAENWVVFECVNRLLKKGYKPEDIILEKVWKTGHGTSGRLDILVSKNKKSFLMIECKTWGKEFDKELSNTYKNGGQLFTYFQQDNNAEHLILYTSNFNKEKIAYKNEIIKIEEDCRKTGNVSDFYDRWNKLTKNNGIFDDWVLSYEFKNRALTLKDLKPIKQENSSFIFNRFLSILRNNVVSDKSNAFNKIFNLFLCKIIDEDRDFKDELKFQWLEGKDDNIIFQKRLTDLYKRGMDELLTKEVTDITDDEFNEKYSSLDDDIRFQILEEITKIRLQKNNEFAIKEVFDEDSFEENAKVLREVVELLQNFKFRYSEKHQYLSDFFELLLTTGLKQESGQFFTPVPVAKFICQSIPLEEIAKKKIKFGNSNDLLPNIIDYSAGSGHFLTESMDKIQKIIDQINEEKFKSQVKKKIKNWKNDQFQWAHDYIYGVEKDYRLVKTAKVGCYLHGDGLAKVIHGDGLDNFKTSTSYMEKLKVINNNFPQDNKQFEIVISNPPYSVSAFRGMMKQKEPEKDFELFSRLTDQSSEIECLFIERTKQLLKDGGMAGIILPSSILNNAGIYTQTREIILKYFEIIGITELGSNTFMATGTNTVVLFLRRRSNYDWQNFQEAVSKFFKNFQDVTVNRVENIFSKYIKYAWKDINLDDYISLCNEKPNKNILSTEIYKEYDQKIKAKNEKDKVNGKAREGGLGQKLEKIISLEKDKLLYFILAYPQKIVLAKTGEKKEEKQFLGYEFSNRRGSEGIHPIQRGKSIDDCTKLYDNKDQENPLKASTYIQAAFKGDLDCQIDKSLEKNIFRVNLVDTLTFDRADFEKNISLSVKKKIKIESKWDLIKLEEICDLYQPRTITSQQIKEAGKYKVFGANGVIGFYDKYNHENYEVAVTCRGATCGTVNFTEPFSWITGNAMVVTPKNEKILKKYLGYILTIQDLTETITGTAQPQITRATLSPFKIPLPPKEIQEKIVKEIEKLEKKKSDINSKIKELKHSINNLFKDKSFKKEKLENLASMLKRGKSPKYGVSSVQIIKSGQARGYKEFDFTDKHFVSEDFLVDERKLEKGDILINSSGIGTAGRVTLFDLNGDFVVDSHISILRLDREKALPDYILYSLAKIGFKTIESMATGQSGQTELSLPIIQNIKISLPPLIEQRKIVKKIKIIENQILDLEKKLKEIPKEKENILENS